MFQGVGWVGHEVVDENRVILRNVNCIKNGIISIEAFRFIISAMLIRD